VKWRDQWQLSFRNIFSAPVRSLLTVLGMSIGIGAILAVLTLGTAGRNQVRAEMTRLGIDRVWLTAARQEEPLMRGDGALLKRELKVAAAEQLTVPVKIAVGDKESETLLVGCDLVCLQMAGSAVTLGKMIPVQEWKQGGNGILLGETLAAELGGGPGTLVSAGGMLFRCAGVLRMEDRASGLDWNRAAFVPLETLSDSVGSSLSQITILTDDRLTPDELARNATRVLKRSRGVEAETLTLQVQSEAAESVIAVFVEVLQAGGRHRRDEHPAGQRPGTPPGDRRDDGTGHGAGAGLPPVPDGSPDLRGGQRRSGHFDRRFSHSGGSGQHRPSPGADGWRLRRRFCLRAGGRTDLRCSSRLPGGPAEAGGRFTK